MREGIKFSVFIVCFLIFFMSCSYSEKDLIHYLAKPEKGLLQERTVNGITVRAAYRPQDLLVKQELDAASVKSDSIVKELRRKYSQQVYFVLSLSKDNQEILNSAGNDRALFSEMLNKISFGLGEQVFLVTSQRDTLKMIDYIAPRTYGMLQANNILFSFENRNLEKSEWVKLILKDLGLHTGDVSFKFNCNDILKVPKLKIL